MNDGCVALEKVSKKQIPLLLQYFNIFTGTQCQVNAQFLNASLMIHKSSPQEMLSFSSWSVLKHNKWKNIHTSNKMMCQNLKPRENDARTYHLFAVFLLLPIPNKVFLWNKSTKPVQTTPVYCTRKHSTVLHVYTLHKEETQSIGYFNFVRLQELSERTWSVDFRCPGVAGRLRSYSLGR